MTSHLLATVPAISLAEEPRRYFAGFPSDVIYRQKGTGNPKRTNSKSKRKAQKRARRRNRA